MIAGSSLSGIVYPIALSRLFHTVGFGWAVRTLAFLNFGCQALAIPLVKERVKPRLGLPLIDFKAYKDVTFLLHCISAFLVAFGGCTPLRYYCSQYLGSPIHTILVHRDFFPS